MELTRLRLLLDRHTTFSQQWFSGHTKIDVYCSPSTRRLFFCVARRWIERLREKHLSTRITTPVEHNIILNACSEPIPILIVESKKITTLSVFYYCCYIYEIMCTSTITSNMFVYYMVRTHPHDFTKLCMAYEILFWGTGKRDERGAAP